MTLAVVLQLCTDHSRRHGLFQLTGRLMVTLEKSSADLEACKCAKLPIIRICSREMNIKFSSTIIKRSGSTTRLSSRSVAIFYENSINHLYQIPLQNRRGYIFVNKA